ncbi:hypothetical protein PINS_up013775 [Pythium insidiosum]|nr:hypothetical protein PINS_up013775 [Pythium insidiosum]
MTSTLSLFLTALVAVATINGELARAADSASSASEGMPGGWSAHKVGANDTERLTKALASSGAYRAGVGATRLCYHDIVALNQQVVAGINYQYDIKACSIPNAEAGKGKCSGELASCAAKTYRVVIFEQVWTNTLEISSIQELDGTTPNTNGPVAPSAGSGSGMLLVGGSPTVTKPAAGNPSDNAVTEKPSKPSTPAPTKTSDAMTLAVGVTALVAVSMQAIAL